MIAGKDRHHDRRKSPSRYCGWVVERTFAWVGRYRRLSKDYERLCATTETLIYIAMSRLMLRRLTAP
jgi:transposase